jgi:acetyl-CoA synthetase
MSEPTIEDYQTEGRLFPPSADFQAQALVADRSLFEEAEADRLGFWARQARELVSWYEDFDQVLDWQLPFAKWFIGGKLNVSYNCLDRHVDAGRGDKVAFHWEGEPGDTRTITYSDLLDEVSKFANALKGLGVERGDRVCIYMPMIPELTVAMLACTRIGAAHSIVFGGFSADSLADRCNDAEAKVLVTSDGGYRRGDPFGLKMVADEACASSPTVESVVVVERTSQDVEWDDDRDHWYHDLMATA